ncbi:MAG TPA: mechanosensitive ion channel domain-containing protein [Lysobacter sp.]|nr:mechanosensitive ion channel domain-containing protein [Lysobacter sp.]
MARLLEKLLLALLLAWACTPAVVPASAAPATAGRAHADADGALAREVARRIHDVPRLGDVVVTARAGEVRLDGTVVSVEDRALAAQIAGQNAGVRGVQNRVRVSARLTDRFEAAYAQVIDKLLRFVASLPVLAIALLVVVAASWLGRLLGRRVRLRRLQRRNPYLDILAQRFVRWMITLAGVLVALDLLGATAAFGAVLGSAGVVGLIAGFAFKDIAENYIAGILLGLRRPFSPGDHVLIDRVHEGKVAALTSRATVLMTLDGNRLTLPNALVFKSVVLNFSHNPKRRFDFLMPVDPGMRIGVAQRAAQEAVCTVDGVLQDPAPAVLVHEFQPDRIALSVQGWIDQRHNDLGRVRSEVMRAVKGALDRAGVARARSLPPLPEDHRSGVENGPHGDTSVNRDIDEQLQAERERHDGHDRNLL